METENKIMDGLGTVEDFEAMTGGLGMRTTDDAIADLVGIAGQSAKEALDRIAGGVATFDTNVQRITNDYGQIS